MPFPRTSLPTLRIELRRQHDHTYAVTLRRLDGGQSDDRIAIDAATVSDWLAQSQQTPDAVGAALAARLFTSRLRGFYRQQLGGAPGGSVRIELCLPEPDNPLHALPWELLHRPVGDAAPLPLAADETTPFARFDALELDVVAPRRWTPPLRLAVVIANPWDLRDFGLDAVAGAALLRELLMHLKPHSDKGRVQVTVLAGAEPDLPPELVADLVAARWPLTPGAATLDNVQRLAETHDLLYLTAHGRRDRLLLESDAGATAEITAAALVDHFSGAQHKPHLIFLAACFSGQRLNPAAPSEQGADAFAAVGPALHAAGIPAVIAMQTSVTIDAAQRVAADFFAALFDPELAGGAVDLALNRARRLLYDRQTPVWAPPVLFCRLRDGLLYASPSAAAPNDPPAPVPTRIPASKTGLLVGRDADLAWLRQRLLAGDAGALVGVKGLGGIGKTELAITAVNTLADAFPGGVFWLECGANDIPAVQQRLADALGLRLTSRDPQTRADQLAGVLRLHPASLIVLDDVRRVHAAAFDQLRPPAPPCALLATSRRSDLPLPPAAIRPLETLTPVEAATLLRFLLAEAGLSGHDNAAIAAIAALLNLPLAVKLAGRRAVLLAQRRTRGASADPLTRLLADLRQSRLTAIELAGGEPRPDLSARAAFALSYDDLTPADQQALRALGVLAKNEFTAETAAALWMQQPAAAADTLRRLANAGLVEEIADDLWDALWELHDLLRDYAGERLRSDAGELLAVQRRHARLVMTALDALTLRTIADWQRLAFWQAEAAQAAGWVAAQATEAAALVADFYLTLAENYPNHTFLELGQWLEICALPAAQQSEQPNSVRRVQRLLGEFWQHHGEPARGEDFLRASLATAEALLAAAVDDAARADATWSVAVTQSSLADLLRTRGQYDAAERLYRESLRVFEAVGDSREVAVTQSSLAALLRTRGQYDEAERLYRESLRVFEAVGDSRSVAVTQSSLADLLRTRGQYDAAERLYRESLRVFEAVGDSRSVAVTQSSLADLLRTRGQYDAAERLYRESLRVFEAVGDSREVAVTQSSLAALLRTRGQYDEAERLYRESLRVKEAVGDSREVAVTQSSLAALLSTRGQYDEAERLYRESLRVFEAVGDSRSVAVTQSSLADLLRTRGQYDAAERLYRESLRVFEAVGDSREVAVTQSSLADLLRTRGQYDAAERLYRESLRVFEAVGDSREVAVTQSSLADLLSTRGQYDEAERLYRESLRVFEAVGDSREVAVTQSSLAALLRTRGQYDEAERLYRESLRVFEAVGDSREVAVTQSSLADLLSTRGQYDAAERLYRESLRVFEAVGDSREVAVTQSSLAALLRTRGQYDEAERLYRESLRVFEAVGDSREVAVTQSSLAALLRTRGQYDEAERLYRESLRVFEAVGDSRSVAVTQSSLADLLSTRGQYDEAERLYRESLRVFEAVGDSREVAVTQSSLAALLRTRGQYDEAERLYRESLRVFEAVGDSRSVAVTQSSLADLLSTRGQYDEAERLYRESLRVKEAVGDSREVAVTQSSLADLLSTRGQYDEAERLYRESLRVFEAVGDSREVAVTQSSLADLLSTRGQYDEAERLYRAGLTTCLQIRDPQGIAVFQRQLGDLALRRGRPRDALPLLEAAHAGFTAIGLSNWLPGVEKLQARARGETLTLDDVLGLVWAARRGDHAAGQRAFDICGDMLGNPDWAPLARVLQRVLAGEDPATVLAVSTLTEADRASILTALLAE